jgi:hypothetical protein
LLPSQTHQTPPPAPWPTRFDGKSLTPLQPAPGDEAFTRNFPGHVARFSDGHHQILLRQVTSATRALHPSRDCFRAIGYAIEPAPMTKAPDGQPRACFTAKRDGSSLHICEEIRDAKGVSYPEISA